MKKPYTPPSVIATYTERPAAPLAFFSVATAAAAAVGAAVGALATKAAIRALPQELRNPHLAEIAK